MDSNLVHFLLVEDNDSHAALISRSFDREGRFNNSLNRVTDGIEALDYLRQRGDYATRPRPDVVLLDLSLPKMDGHELLAAIKRDPQLQTIPVVILTTSDNDADRRKAYQLHANSYLVKPANFDQFRQMVCDLNVYWGVWNRPSPS